MVWIRASQIYSVRARQARPGLIPHGRSQFYQLLKAGKFPAPDGYVGSSPVWSDELVEQAIKQLDKQLPEPESQT